MRGAAQTSDLEGLDEALRSASAPTRELFLKVAERAFRRDSLRQQSSKTAPICRLIEVGAWTEAAINVVEFALPDWTMRRIACEQGEWLCSLSRQPSVPLAVDETADASNRVLALAILSAFIEASIRDATTPRAGPSVPLVGSVTGQLICCDDFA